MVGTRERGCVPFLGSVKCKEFFRS